MPLSRVNLILWDVAALLASLWLGYEIRFDFAVPAAAQHTFPWIFPWVVGLQVFCLWRFRQFEVLLGYFSIAEASQVFWAMFITSLFIFGVSTQMGSDLAPPRSVVLTDFGFSVIGLTAIRLAFRPGTPRSSSRKTARPGKRAHRA